MSIRSARGRRVRLLAGFMVSTAIGLGLFSPAYAQRTTETITAKYDPQLSTLSVEGTSFDDTIAVGRDATGSLLVNGGAIAISGARPSVTNTSVIRVLGRAGNDRLSIDEHNGPMPSAVLMGGTGNDVLSGGSAVDRLLGETGNDRIIWAAEQGDDFVEGGADNDIAEINGDDSSEAFSVSADGARVRVVRSTARSSNLDIGTVEVLLVNANGGNDTMSAGTGLATT
jgi:Ca2+-binding RTX toxin-like protein